MEIAGQSGFIKSASQSVERSPMGPRAGGLGARFRETLPRSAGCVDVAPLTVRHRYDCGSQDGDAPSRGWTKRGDLGDSDRAYARFEWVGCVFRWSDIRRYGSSTRQNGNTGLSRLTREGRGSAGDGPVVDCSSREELATTGSRQLVTERNWTPPLSQTWQSDFRQLRWVCASSGVKCGCFLFYCVDGGEYT